MLHQPITIMLCTQCEKVSRVHPLDINNLLANQAGFLIKKDCKCLECNKKYLAGTVLCGITVYFPTDKIELNKDFVDSSLTVGDDNVTNGISFDIEDDIVTAMSVNKKKYPTIDRHWLF